MALPSQFRTDWAGRSMIREERSVPDYDDLMDPIRANRKAAHGNQLGEPAKAAQAVLTVIEEPNPPAHLLLGSDALRLVTNGRKAVDDEIARWADLTRSTDLVEGARSPAAPGALLFRLSSPRSVAWWRRLPSPRPRRSPTAIRIRKPPKTTRTRPR